jgi:hypothetical protein
LQKTTTSIKHTEIKKVTLSWKQGYTVVMATRKHCHGNKETPLSWKQGNIVMETRKRCHGNNKTLPWKQGNFVMEMLLIAEVAFPAIFAIHK